MDTYSIWVVILIFLQCIWISHGGLPCPVRCDISKCKDVGACNGGIVVKDKCGCCPRCSSDIRIHPSHPFIRKGGPCEQVECPKFKICVENMQGLPICTCPNLLICNRRKGREICGSDGMTYKSRCHMRVTICSSGKRVKLRHKGACPATTGMVSTQGREQYPVSEFDFSKKRRKQQRRKERRKHRKNNRNARRRYRRFKHLRRRRLVIRHLKKQKKRQ